jgi:hypothetical protein
VEHEYYSSIANCRAKITAIFRVIFWILEIFKNIYSFIYLFHDFRGTPRTFSGILDFCRTSVWKRGCTIWTFCNFGFYCNLRSLHVSYLYVIATGNRKIIFHILQSFLTNKMNKPLTQHSHKCIFASPIYCRQA